MTDKTNKQLRVLSIRTPFGAPIYYKDSCDSTMNEAAVLTSAAHGTVCAAGYQNSGRGRGVNRRWESGEGENLLFTIILRPEKTSHPPVRMPLICALALADCLKEDFGVPGELKWPNDILVGGKKISGILCEYRGGRLLAGLGINVTQKHFPEEIAGRTTSLALESEGRTTPLELLETFLPRLARRLEDGPWQRDAEAMLYGWERELEVLEGGADSPRRLRIRILGLTQEGFLLIRDLDRGEERSLTAGEISFRGFGNFR